MAAEKAQALKADVDSQIQMFEQRLKPLKEAVIFSAPEGMALTSGEDMQLVAGRNLAINAGSDISVGVMGNLTALTGEKLGLFARTGQLSLKSGEGPIDVQAQNASMRLFAEKKLTLSSASDISFAGKKRITLIGGGSYLKLEAGKVEYGTTAMYVRKVKRTMAASAASQQPEIPCLANPVKNSFDSERNDKPGIRIVPNIQLINTIGVISYLERIDGKAMYSPVDLDIGNVKFIKKWLSSDGRLYVIPPGNLLPADTVLLDGKEKLQLECDVFIASNKNEYIDSLIAQMNVLDDFIRAYKTEGDDEFNYAFINGYLRYWKALDNLMDEGLTIDEQKYLQSKLGLMR